MTRPTRLSRSGSTGSFYVRIISVVLVVFLLARWAYYFFWQTADVDHVISNSVPIFRSSSTAAKVVGKSPQRSRRRFLNYKSSVWEALWLKNIAQWTKEQTICDHVFSADQAEFLHTFQMTLCTHLNLHGTPWCAIDDPFYPTRYFYNAQTRQYALSLPKNIATWDYIETIPPTPVVPVEQNSKNPQVFSQFNYLDETTGQIYSEYIEPLVSHLRHPVARCEDKSQGRLLHRNLNITFVFSRSFIIPLSTNYTFRKKHYFDAGCSTWNAGKGGPSLHYFTTMWKRHGIDFDRIEGWEGEGSKENFYASVPKKYKDRTFYHQEFIASSPTTHGTFLPYVIRDTTRKDDYVLVKLDIDNGPVEKGTVKYLLDELQGYYDPDAIQYIDEFVWEHHAGGNYLMHNYWNKTRDELSLWDSYQFFLKLRNKGVRAHSYV